MRSTSLLTAFFLLFACVYGASVPVYVMLPLDAIGNNNQVTNPTELLQWLQQLKTSGADGVMTDVWWGLVESQAGHYDWSGYSKLFSIVQEAKLSLKVIMSFHQCGGNVGDACNVPLPSWVLSVGNGNPNIFYKDREGGYDKEYLSCGVDNVGLFPPGSRTAVGMYADFMSSFANTFSSMLGSFITEVQVGLGPAGELRYPSYQLSKWKFPGIGEFQCYDSYLLAELAAAARAAGQPSWGTSGPSNAGTYNSVPSGTGFFGNGNDNYRSPYGQFFLEWYSKRLIQHGNSILSRANSIFGNRNNLLLAGKVAGIHWWYKDATHAAELTAGYKNDRGAGYINITNMFAANRAIIDFTCLEMRDSEQPSSCSCGPEELVLQTLQSAKSSGIKYGGENALPRYDSTAYAQIENQSSRLGAISGFGYLRLGSDLLNSGNFATFKQFVQKMHNL